MAEEVKPIDNETPENNIGVAEFNPFQTQDISQEDLIQDEPTHKVVEAVKEEIKKEDNIVAEKPATVEKSKEEAVANQPILDEYSQKLFDNLKEGKEDILFEYLREKRELASVSNLSAEDQIKLNLKYQNPEYSQEEVDDLFAESFSKPEAPEKPVQYDDELDTEFQAREAKYNKELATFEKKSKSYENKISREGKNAVKSLTARQKEIVLPDISKKEQVAPEPTAEEIAEAEKVYSAYLKSIDTGVSDFNGFSTEVTDGNLKLPITYAIPDDEKAALKDELKDFNVQDFFRSQWLNEDGSWNGKQYAEDVYWMKNKTKILQKTATQAANQRLEQHLKEQKNIDYSGGRTTTPSVATGIDSLREAAFSKQW